MPWREQIGHHVFLCTRFSFRSARVHLFHFFPRSLPLAICSSISRVRQSPKLSALHLMYKTPHISLVLFRTGGISIACFIAAVFFFSLLYIYCFPGSKSVGISIGSASNYPNLLGSYSLDGFCIERNPV